MRTTTATRHRQHMHIFVEQHILSLAGAKFLLGKGRRGRGLCWERKGASSNMQWLTASKDEFVGNGLDGFGVQSIWCNRIDMNILSIY